MKTKNLKAEASAKEKKDNKKGKEGANKKPSIVGLIISVAVFAFLIAADQVSKYCATEYLTFGRSIEVIPGFFSLTLTYNKGMAFGMLNDSTAGMIAVTVFTVIIMAAIVVTFIKTGLSRPGLKIILSVIEAGAIGNLVDRILMFTGKIEGVRDFLDISDFNLFSFINGGFNFGICNVADFCVTLGGVAIVVYMIVYLATDNGDKKEDISPETTREEIYKGEYVEKDVSSLEEIPVVREDDKKQKNG